jgi:hypothetical protein
MKCLHLVLVMDFMEKFWNLHDIWHHSISDTCIVNCIRINQALNNILSLSNALSRGYIYSCIFSSVLHNLQSVMYGTRWTCLLFAHSFNCVLPLLSSLLITFLSLCLHRLSDATRKHLGLETTELQLEKWILLLSMHKLLMVTRFCLVDLSYHVS